MKPGSALMIEHRLIERMIELIRSEIRRMAREKVVDFGFIETAVDFFHMYADETHHGKEEEIMFTVLARKSVSDRENALMRVLALEHEYGRKKVFDLVCSCQRYCNGDEDALHDIQSNLRYLVDFYPAHMEKEDKEFFPSMEKYLSPEEKEGILLDFAEFDKNMIHKRYSSILNDLERKRTQPATSVIPGPCLAQYHSKAP